jgi:hypothetical protein
MEQYAACHLFFVVQANGDQVLESEGTWHNLALISDMRSAHHANKVSFARSSLLIHHVELLRLFPTGKYHGINVVYSKLADIQL